MKCAGGATSFDRCERREGKKKGGEEEKKMA